MNFAILKCIMDRFNFYGGKTAVISAVCLCVILASVFFTQHFDAEAVIGGQGNLSSQSGHKHNFAAGSGGVEAQDQTRLCVFCHTPHDAIEDASLINAPLWNHTLSEATYTVSTPPGSTGTQLSQPSNPPDGASKLCLSCHDGTVSVGNVRSVTGGIQMVTGGCLDTDGSIANTCSAYLGTDISGKHMVSIAVNDTLKNEKNLQCDLFLITETVKYPWDPPNALPDTVLLRPTQNTYSGTPGVTRATGKYKSGYNYGVQCSSCHDPHYWVPDSGSNGQADAEGEFFVVTDMASLCQACHTPCP